MPTLFETYRYRYCIIWEKREIPKKLYLKNYMYIHLFLHLSVRMSVCPSVSLFGCHYVLLSSPSICHSNLNKSVFMNVCLSMTYSSVFVYPAFLLILSFWTSFYRCVIRLSVCPSACLSVRLSVRPPVCPSAFLSVRLFVRLKGREKRGNGQPTRETLKYWITMKEDQKLVHK